jgi:hydroxymethylpyrimidine pyrophosphatase-like HAD family hydrolase
MEKHRTGEESSARGRFLGMVVSDLDGTLLKRDQTASPEDLATLAALGNEPVIRVIATGRSLYSARKVLHEGFPIDYLIFSSGAGIMDWRSGALVKTHTLSAPEVARAASTLKAHSADFMIHRPIPDNHYFVSYHSGRVNFDFARRCEIYRDFATHAGYGDAFFGEACEVLAVEPPDGRPPCEPEVRALHVKLAESLSPLKVIRATSPIDGASTWVEIFPAGVSKAHASEWIALREGLEREKVLALGNDYNDLDLLEWAPVRYVVENAPESLRTSYPSVGHHEESAFTEAVHRWKRCRHARS